MIRRATEAAQWRPQPNTCCSQSKSHVARPQGQAGPADSSARLPSPPRPLSFGMIDLANAQAGKSKPTQLPAIKPGTNTSFSSLKEIDAGVLNVGYAEAGPTDGPPVILLHGWPYDIHSYVDVAPLLASAGYRAIVPYLRGYGATRFLSSETLRNGQPSALAVDVISLMDALKIEKAILAGFDWGARSANIVDGSPPTIYRRRLRLTNISTRHRRGKTMLHPRRPRSNDIAAASQRAAGEISRARAISV